MGGYYDLFLSSFGMKHLLHTGRGISITINSDVLLYDIKVFGTFAIICIYLVFFFSPSHWAFLGVFRDIWPDRNGPLPWRLTQDEIKMLDKRMKKVVWPHYIDRLHYEGCSFWIKPGRMWKTRRKVVGSQS